MSEQHNPDVVPPTSPASPRGRTPAGFGWVPAFIVIVSVIVLIIGVIGVIFGLINASLPLPDAELSSGVVNGPADIFSAIAFAGICVAPGIMGTIIGAYLWARERSETQ